MDPVPGCADIDQPKLELLTRTGCHLCTAAREVVASAAADLGLAWSETVIDGDPALTARYGEDIPVVLVNGIQRDFWHIDPVRLRMVLKQSMAQH